MNATYLLNLTNGEELLAENADQETAVASLTKVMTVYVAIQKNQDLSQKVKITSEMLAVDPEFVTVGLRVGDELTLEELLYATLLPSAADAAQALAIATSGSLEEFVQLMNEQATEWGMTHTHFSNTVGYDEGNFSSARDMAIMGKNAVLDPTFQKVFAAKEYYLPSLDRTVQKTLVQTAASTGDNIDNITGAKTGFTNDAGRCLLTTAKYGDVDFLQVVLGQDNNDHLSKTLATYQYFDENYQFETLAAAGEVLETLRVKGATEDHYDIVLSEDVSVYLAKTHGDLKLEIAPVETLEKTEDGFLVTNSFKSGDSLGALDFIIDGETVATVPIAFNSDMHFYDFPLINSLVAIGIILVSCLIAFVLHRRALKKSAKPLIKLPK